MFESKTAPLIRYGLGAFFAAALHGGVVAWSLHASRPEHHDIPDGAFVVELADDTASVRMEQHEIAVGEQSDAAAPVASSTPEQQQTAAPDVRPEELSAPEAQPIDPDLVLSNREQESPTEQASSEARNVTAPDTPASAAVAASDAAMQHYIETSKQSVAAPRSRNAGLSRQERREIEDWRRDIVGHINRHKRYPAESRRARDEGTVEITFTMDRQGRILNAKISKSSGIERLDLAAVAILGLAEPLPKPPASINAATIKQTIPITYRWRN